MAFLTLLPVTGARAWNTCPTAKAADAPVTPMVTLLISGVLCVELRVTRGALVAFTAGPLACAAWTTAGSMMLMLGYCGTGGFTQLIGMARASLLPSALPPPPTLADVGAVTPGLAAASTSQMSPCATTSRLARRYRSLIGMSKGRRIAAPTVRPARSEEHTSELQSRSDLVCRL